MCSGFSAASAKRPETPRTGENLTQSSPQNCSHKAPKTESAPVANLPQRELNLPAPVPPSDHTASRSRPNYDAASPLGPGATANLPLVPEEHSEVLAEGRRDPACRTGADSDGPNLYWSGAVGAIA